MRGYPTTKDQVISVELYFFNFVGGSSEIRTGIMMAFRSPVSLPPISLSMQTKVTVISVTVGITLLSFLARILGRRRRNPPKLTDKLNPFAGRKPKQGSNLPVANGDINQGRSNISPSYYRHHRQGSVCSDRQSVNSALITTLNLETGAASTSLTPQQLGAMGMEALETAIGYWEDALSAYRPPPGEHLALTDANEGKFTHMVEKILDQAYKIQEYCSHLFLSESSVLFKAESIASSRHDRYSESDKKTIVSMSSMESFVSAQAEVADLDDFDEFADLNIDLKEVVLYQTALKKYEEGAIPIRLLRTEMLKCQTNMEYIAKVHCVRVAFQLLFEQESVHTWFIDIGSKVLTNLMLCGEKDPKDCLAAYEDIIAYSKDKTNWPVMEEELKSRDVRCLSFYDVVLDFIVLDAFEDLENPPSSVTAVVQNRWLSSGFKETALATAVWSVLKAKRRMLKFPDGFISRFYHISEHLIPVLAWGFLGTNERLKEICNYFKDEVMGFMFDIFNFKKVRYTKVDELAVDVLEMAKVRFERTCERLIL